jgi:hypothetical protein
MEPERDEVYERIPWETLEPTGGNRQWLVYAVAAALVLGALAYSFTRNQAPSAPPQAAEPAVTTVPATMTTTAVPPPSTAASPIVVAEADLFAVEPERLLDVATAHAEWFATEYVSYDGTSESATVLEGLLPEGTPLPQAPEGTQVFVDWAGAMAVAQTGPVTFDVDVIVRSLFASDGSAFTRQAPRRIVVSVELDDDGRPSISRPPRVEPEDPVARAEMNLQPLPSEVVENLRVEGEVVGGLQGVDGGWLVVVMTAGPDGVTRPATVATP